MLISPSCQLLRPFAASLPDRVPPPASAVSSLQSREAIPRRSPVKIHRVACVRSASRTEQSGSGMNMTVSLREFAGPGRAAILALVMLGAAQAGSAGSQASGVAYPQMAPSAQYLMPNRAAEISLARSAAPTAILEALLSWSCRPKATRLRSMERTDSPVSWRERGCRLLTVPSSGIQS